MAESERAIAPVADEPSTFQPPASSLSLLSGMSDVEWTERVDGLKKSVARLHELYTDVMVDGVHYDVIPGTKKPSLLKPGAELLFKLYRCVPEYERTTTYGDGDERPRIAVVTVCRARHLDSGLILSAGAGTCNSHERKYRWRNADRMCPECGKRTIRRGSAQYGGGFFCSKRDDGCGARFEKNDPQITSQILGQVENPDILEVENTVLKMSDKRAFVACALTLGAASGMFGQDLEDDPAAAASSGGGGSRESGGGAPGGDQPIDDSKKKLLEAMAKRRAKELGFDEDAGSTILTQVLAAHGIENLAAVTMGKLNAVIGDVQTYEPPSDG